MKRNTIEVVMLGDDNTGKTALMRAFDHQPFLETLPPSKEPGFLNNPAPTAHDPDPSISLRVVDVPDTHDPYGGNNLRRNFLRTADAVVICFETTEASSFADAKKYMNPYRDNTLIESKFVLWVRKRICLEQSIVFRKVKCFSMPI